MSWFGNVTGKDALQRMEATAAEMERVYLAIATRLIEVLEKEQALQGMQEKLGQEQRRVAARGAELDRAQAEVRTGQQQVAQRLAAAERLAAELAERRDLVQLVAAAASLRGRVERAEGLAEEREAGAARLASRVNVAVVAAAASVVAAACALIGG